MSGSYCVCFTFEYRYAPTPTTPTTTTWTTTVTDVGIDAATLFNPSLTIATTPIAATMSAGTPPNPRVHRVDKIFGDRGTDHHGLDRRHYTDSDEDHQHRPLSGWEMSGDVDQHDSQSEEGHQAQQCRNAEQLHLQSVIS
ncbi:hypothetical protein [Rhodococcus koreensis]